MSTDTDTGQADNYLEMSDEDIANMELPPEPTIEPDGESSEASSDDTNDGVTEEEDNEQAGQESGTEGDSSGTGSEGEGESEGTEGDSVSESSSESEVTESSGTEEVSGSESTEASEQSGQASGESGQNSETVTEIDYQKNFSELMAPLKANGKTNEIRSIEEARRLMSMGSNYHAKMAELKPNMKILKMLSNNDILDEKKLSFLIDISKNDKTAIAKLIKDSDYNTLEHDSEKDSGYESNTYTVSDSEVDLDRILQEVQATETGERTLDIMSNRWDDASKQKIAKDPAIVSVINEHMQSGIYDQIQNEIDRARTMGQYTGINALDAYEQMGRHMSANNLFKGMEKTTPTIEKKLTVADLKPAKSVADTPQLKNRKKAASATRSNSNVKKKLQGIDLLNMSDEDFAKLELPT